jgi:DNA-binding NarL/FixJ family response regulator
MIYKVIIVDDHALMAKGITSLIHGLKNYEVTYDVRNGKELMTVLQAKNNLPDIILLDINMPVMNGFETMEWLKANHPDIPVLALTINDDENSVIRMLRLGVKGYLIKDTDSDELVLALDTIMKRGYYTNELMNTALRHSLNETSKTEVPFQLKERELEFLQLACSELTYQQIADKMFLSPKTVDHYREALFEKMNVKSRVGLVLVAIKFGFYDNQ